MNSLIRYGILLLSLLANFIARAQYSVSAHYTVKDGLPASTVYCMAQDKNGFMWIGTEAGLVRYDGTNFKVFTTKDGLPDNGVLGIVLDKVSERIWLATYSTHVCYYQNK
jgi:ligand-binding sensor domain-containing protein